MQFTWDHIHYLEVRPYQNVKSIRQAVFKLPHSQEISCIGYNVNLQTAVAAILVFVECRKYIASQVLVVLRPYQNVKSIRQAVFKISCSQAISCIGYNVNLQTAVAAILVFIECPKSIASEVLVVLRSYQNVKSIPLAVFKISRSQAIVDGRTDGPKDGQGHSIIRFVCGRRIKIQQENVLSSNMISGYVSGWFVSLFVFYVPSTARSFRDGIPIYCPL